MTNRVFVDSNIFLYLMDDDFAKKSIAAKILFSDPVIDTQVIFENVNVCQRKFKLSADKVKIHVESLLAKCELTIVSEVHISKAFALQALYKYQFFDCVIIASALEANCTTLYSEDLQHGQIIENELTIVNPFL